MDCRVALAGLALLFAGAAFADPPVIAPPPAPPTSPPDPDAPAPAFEPPCQRFLPWLGVEYNTAPQLDAGPGYSRFDAFVPFRQWDNGLFFVNAAGLVNNFDDWSSNLGGGLRWYNPATCRILGANGYWDYRDTGANTFDQAGAGVESLGRYVDFRANGYIPFGNTQPVNAVSFDDPRFFEHFILLNQHNFGQAALSGFDTELGGTLPRLEPYGLRAYAGVYSYQGPDTGTFVGGHFRLEERLTDDVNLDLTVNSDPQFKTTVIFGASIRLGGEKRRVGSSRGDVYSRLVDPVYRNDNITVVDQEVTTPVIATKPGTNDPIIVDHAASYAAAGGDGTFEHPYTTLPQLQAGSHPGDILFVWANSVFTGQNITLQNNQRFLGEGLTYLFTASQGTFVLPRATNFTNLPVIQNAPGNAVTLANSNEVAGFVIRGAAQDGIFGNGVTDFNIHDNVITGSGLNGIVLLNLGATGTIANNVVSNNGDMVSAVAGGPLFGEGIYLQGTDFTGNITGNTANNNGDLSGSVATVFHNTGLGATFGQGIAVNVGTFSGSISGNTANGNGVVGAPAAGGTGVNTTISGTTTFGQGIAVNAGAFNGNISGNTANDNGVIGTVPLGFGVENFGGTTTFGQGIAVNAGAFNGNISGNTANDNGVIGTVSLGFGVSAATATTTFGQGIAVNATTFNGSITGNTANDNGVIGTVSLGFGVSAASATTTFGQGIAVNASTFTGDISGNTAIGNGVIGPVPLGFGVAAADATTTFGQGILLQAANGTATLANNTLMNNGEFGPAGGGATNVSQAGGSLLFGQGMLLQGSGSGSFFAFVQNNRFGPDFGTQNANNNGTPGTDLLAIYTGSGKMGVELEGNTTTNPFTTPPPFNYDLQNQDGGMFHLENNQGTTGGNGSATPADGVGTDPTAGPVPF